MSENVFYAIICRVVWRFVYLRPFSRLQPSVLKTVEWIRVRLNKTNKNQIKPTKWIQPKRTKLFFAYEIHYFLLALDENCYYMPKRRKLISNQWTVTNKTMLQPQSSLDFFFSRDSLVQAKRPLARFSCPRVYSHSGKVWRHADTHH